MEKVKVGIIGVGNMGYNHVRVYNELISDVELIGVYDVAPCKAKDIAGKFNVKAFDTIETLTDSVQAVSIATPTSLHLEHGLVASKAGVHALIEKPIAVSYVEAKQLADSFQENNLVLQIGHIERYNPAIVELKKILQSETIHAINFRRLSSDRRIYDTDIIHDLMIHDIDLMNWLVESPVKTIHAEGLIDVLGNDSIDYTESLLKFENGVVAGLVASRITEDKIRTITVHTANSYIMVDCVSRSVQISRKTDYKLDIGHDITYRQENILEKVIVPQYEPLKAQLSDFIRCVKTGAEPMVNGSAGLEAVRIADEITRLVK
jgi:predicted dehydrogenase